MAIKLSKEACVKAINYSTNARDQIMMNINVMNNNVNSQFSGLKDPSFQRYLALSEQMQEMLRQMSGKIEAISEYCQSVIRWIDTYSEI